MNLRRSAQLLSIIAAALAPGSAAAHAGERGFVLLMPTEYYVTGGGAAVLLSFLALAALPPRWLDAAFAWRGRWRRAALGVGGLEMRTVCGSPREPAEAPWLGSRSRAGARRSG